MPTVMLMEFDKDKRNFQALQDIELSSVPTSGDKVVIDINNIGFIFKVYDVHYRNNNRTDVNVIRISRITQITTLHDSPTFTDFSTIRGATQNV
jgi:hypothetical protein